MTGRCDTEARMNDTRTAMDALLRDMDPEDALGRELCRDCETALATVFGGDVPRCDNCSEAAGMALGEGVAE